MNEENRKKKVNKTDLEGKSIVHSLPSFDVAREMAIKYKETIKKLTREIKKLVTEVDASKTTKLEIKEITCRLNSLASVVSTNEMQEVIDRSIGSEELNSIVYVEQDAKSTQTQSTQTDCPIVKEMATQTLNDSIYLLEEFDQEMSKDTRDYHHYCSLLKKEWPEEAYKITKVRYDSFDENQACVAFWVEEEDTKMERGIARRMKSKYPDLIEIEDDVGTLTLITRITGKDGRPFTKEKKVIKLKEKDSTKDLLNTLCSLSVELNSPSDGTLKVAMFSSKRHEADLRKMLEYILRGTNIEIDIYIEGTQKKNKGREEDKIVIKQENVSYADLLKKIKTAVGTNKEGIKEVRKTKDGSVLLVVDKKGKRSTNISARIGEYIQGAQLKTVTRNRPLFHVFDLDEVTTKEEVASSLANEICVSVENIEVTNIRPTRSGKYMATVAAAENCLWKLKNLTKVGIGLAPCRIKERRELKKCFRCWEYGHDPRECKGQDRSKSCLKCGKEGHRAVDCSADEYCPLCSQEGHRAGTGKCPKFRQALLAMTPQKRTPGKKIRNRRTEDGNARLASKDPLLEQ